MTKDEIIEGWERGLLSENTHMIIVCNTFSHEYFPVYVSKGENVYDKIKEYSSFKNILSIKEIYNYAIDLESQLHEVIAYNPQIK